MSLLKSAAKVGGYTTISRVLGFIRDQLIAFTLGTSDVAEAFFIAQRFPNLFRTLFAEGAFNAAFVPLFAKRVEGEGIVLQERFSLYCWCGCYFSL
jgi:putative peptidoglycan lipid II flippase